MKQGRKNAVKLFNNADDANAKAAELGKTHFVETRRGESTKCRHYCLCRKFCNYYQSMMPQTVSETELSKAA
jgi:hypothetical protein